MHMVNAKALSAPMKELTHRAPLRSVRVNSLMHGVDPPPSLWPEPRSRRGHRALSNSWSNYELFNSSSINIRYWSWNYRGCWHQACPPIDTHRHIYISSIAVLTWQCQVRLLFLFAASVMCYHWAIYAPAANLSCGSRFSGSLSGIEP